MARYFNGREVELLAPAGTFEIFKKVIDAGCDAVYFGGPSLNMRLMRKGYNFSLEEITEAVRMAHERGKKVYVTVNNLLNESELDEARAYLRFLENAGPDAIIVQDFAVLALIKEMGLGIDVHSSVMMNVHNVEMVRALQEMGVTRVVTSREMDLAATRYLQQATGMELEYFVHGDMCSVHGANCYFSSMVFGMSSNRGKCMKPCRWDYRVKKDGYVYPAEYPLAVKDMFMYEHIPELIHGGITSFKIEGRMRDADFVLMLVGAYGDAIDRYIADPVGFERNRDTELLYQNRKRDFSTAYAFGRPGLANINRRYEGTGKFYSTGKVFSTPTQERELSAVRIAAIREGLDKARHGEPGEGACRRSGSATVSDAGSAEVSVHVNNTEQAKAALKAGADHVYLSGDVFEPDRPFTKADVKELAALKGKAKLYLCLPRMMNELQFEIYDALLSGERLPIDGLMVTNLGAIRKFAGKGYPLIGDFNLNVYNRLSADFYRGLGLTRMTASMEMPLNDLAALLAEAPAALEVIVHGSPAIMYMEHDLYENTEVFEPIAEEDNHYVGNHILVLKTDKGENPVYRDVYGRNHLMLAKELCLLPAVKELAAAGASVLRIEGATYRAEDLERIVRAYKNAAAAPDTAEAEFAKLPPVYAGYTLGALQFDGGSASAAKAEAEAAAAKGAAVVNEAAGTNEAKAAIEAAGPK
ncbi:peptidase U32 family protein [Paenibacillus macerans]|uniref:Peptidase U32 family protein n=1 Tax=Paenibacillus macerans TaxID=44252 RepID=A0A090ZAQ5_PAEMA|nr:U32 family peptidase [Paenibacillus macerans]KFN07473.1 peptidase U32 family protein [Paenibacillus macerans]MCY7557562.1 U32 family peptidase [Paenibacillus macerans]MEC0154837.1 U32 family peptidase [Paenibacillus macerans]SUA85833.1 peptidase U32 [Paenibacillus macerans]